MKDVLTKTFTDFNKWLIRSSKGKIGSQLGTQSILILHTTGRKTGRPRATPIAYFDYEGKFLLVGSNWGRQKQADWYLNLQRSPNARIEIDGRSMNVRAREAQDGEYARLWEYVTGRHAPYVRYQTMTSRRIPIVVLERAD